jgi:hypothetical protein
MLGSVTNYGTKMENVHCSSTERMVVKSADYGDFNVNGIFNDDKNIDSQCSKLTNCQVKSLCDGKRSCELTIDNNLLPSAYCSDTSKQIYIRYTCVREYRPTAVKSGKAKCIDRRSPLQLSRIYIHACNLSKTVALSCNTI